MKHRKELVDATAHFRAWYGGTTHQHLLWIVGRAVRLTPKNLRPYPPGSHEDVVWQTLTPEEMKQLRDEAAERMKMGKAV